MSRLRALVLCIVWATLCAAQPADLDVWVENTRKAFEVPGIAVGIVKDGRTVYAKGFGLRRLGDTGTVDDRTVFGVASNTKAFTAAALALLVDEGKIAWDDPVQKHLPAFTAYDPYVSRELTVRDTLCHRSGLGLGAGDLLFWPDTDVSRAQVIAATRFIKPASSIRSKYAYNNLMFVVAGEIVAAVSGRPYEEFVTERILKPLGMEDSYISFRDGPNVAIPHSRCWRLEGGTLAPITPTKDHTWAAAAGLKSNVHDMLKWLNAHLNGKRPWKDTSAREMWQVQTPLPVTDPPAALKSTKAGFAGYGLGWSLRDYKGRKIVTHGGGLTGMVTITLMVPEERLGIVVLTNHEESGALMSVVFRVLDHYLALPAWEWIAAYRAQRSETLSKAREAEAKLEAERAKESRPSLPLAAYAGKYRDDWYGEIPVEQRDGTLVLRFSRTPSMLADLKHWHYDTFRAVFRDNTIPDAFVTFSLDARGRVESARMQAVSSLADFSFDYHDLLLKPSR
jgi:CubicO group peptidase (beta-lactamase class C family)